MSKQAYTLHLKPSRNGPSGPLTVEKEKILANDVTLPLIDYPPDNTKLWLIGHEHGVMGAVWAGHEHDALDELVDQGMADAVLIDEEDATEDTLRAGNASEPLDSDHLWIAEVELKVERDIEFLLVLAYCKGAGYTTLSEY